MCIRDSDEMARYCITHSFVDNDIRLTAGGPLRTDTEALVAPYLETISRSLPIWVQTSSGVPLGACFLQNAIHLCWASARAFFSSLS